jgi:tetratricopeptide (TPR) repeat protein
MDLLNGVSADQLFVTSLQQQSQLEALSNNALSSGIDKYLRKEYEAAAKDFEKSINLYPTSSFSADTTKYLAQTHLRLDKTDKAIQTYQRGIQLNPERDDLHAELGNLYFAEDRYDEALKEYHEAVRVNPASSSNHYSLGQGYLKLEKFSQAEDEFRTVIRMEGNSPYGYYGLGLTYSKREKFEKAIANFETAIRKDAEFYDAHAEIGYAYADMGELEKAQELADFLADKDGDLSSTLSLYMNKVEPPKILFALGSGTFRYSMSINTPVSSLDSYLENAGAEKSLTMKFVFNKQMDRSSVEDPFNWSISRSMGAGDGSAYNFGLALPSTEISLPAFPNYALYDSDTGIATVSFTVRQNETADGTIDPNHIVFKFNGKDIYGIKMDEDHDEFSGWSGVA